LRQQLPAQAVCRRGGRLGGIALRADRVSTKGEVQGFAKQEFLSSFQLRVAAEVA
jgi:hypothetical protein